MSALWKFLSSLRLTIYLLVVSVVLVLFGTLDQVHDGIYLTQQRYFEYFFVVWKYPEQWIGADALGWIHLPLPGGYLVGPLLVLNLLVAHFRYYRAGWRKFGIALLHLGVVGLLLGQLIAQLAQTDYYMWLAEGDRSNFLEAFHEDELVVIDHSPEGLDRVYSWSTRSIPRTGRALHHPELPFVVEVERFFPNAAIFARSRNPQAPDLGINRGIAATAGFTATEQAPTYATDTRNLRTAIVEIIAEGESQGRWMLSNAFRQNRTAGTRQTFPAQTFEVDGRTFEIAIRNTRHYLPAHIELLDFSHDKYPGTEIPVNFSSEVRLLEGTDADATKARTNLIYMNHPMRYAGFIFYQASFGNNDTMSMFQVVRNPGRWVPYIACTVITIGMLWQFLWSLFVFVRRKRTSSVS